MAEILYGNNVAAAMEETLMREVEELVRKGVTPTLAIVRVGERGDDTAYERGAIKRCEKVGIAVRRFALPLKVTETELLYVVETINSDDGIHACLMFRPLPEGIDEARVCNSLAPEKDVDGITEGSMAGVFTGSGGGYPPCTAQACRELLTHYGIGLSGKKVVVIGRSLVIGKPVAMLLLAENATVTICHSRTEGLAELCRAADVLIVAMGRAGLVDARFINPDGIVVDVGINVDGAGNLCGDVEREYAELAKAYSPVPGGVGAVTTSVLAAHVVDAVCKASGYTQRKQHK
ncbi:MAG: bifunctional 5,10-methylenetetrahydrofolate dehydrogenase/5,10-methenyltetrahydrofolate cyclohydrolase [Clostridiales Family XIII bacterium]|jgi:methylenetetrahydrofolate dehydrogenase (NADP+)/methenyltetrahydrofolate cyclohydrolase|nr:bifunctional 5,10-methylenetetrahydrofolate dehydrogenase/5,10-methenyltetrahydrofolate cyclohydrolase [Clostridiales Family XIII bacterium]